MRVHCAKIASYLPRDLPVLSLSGGTMLTRSSLLIAVLAVQSCMFGDVKKQQEIIATYCVLEGEVSAERRDPVPLIVVLVQQTQANQQLRKSWRVADHFVVDVAGHWRFRTAAGTYGLVAFQDIHPDLKHQIDEPYLRLETGSVVTCVAGEPHSGLVLNVPADGRPRSDEPLDLASVQARSVDDQLLVTLGSVTAFGDIVTLADARFAAAVAEDGLWRPFDFLFKGRPGIYFLEPYDSRKIPVLFVHGIGGSPAGFASLIGRLDRGRFQPWVYYYPSGGALDAIADHLTQTFRTLQVKHGFDSFAVVAHSMGGLVSRGFLLRYAESRGHAESPLFVSISTPWGGHKAAELGVRMAPAVVKVWVDMAPDSAYQRALFYKDPEARTSPRELPPGTSHHLLFTFRQDSLNLGEASDGSVTVASQLRWEAQHEARRLYGINETHTGVLESEETSTLINDVLTQAFSPAPEPAS